MCDNNCDTGGLNAPNILKLELNSKSLQSCKIFLFGYVLFFCT